MIIMIDLWKIIETQENNLDITLIPINSEKCMAVIRRISILSLTDEYDNPVETSRRILSSFAGFSRPYLLSKYVAASSYFVL